ncbi:MAG: protein kinase domain-containing protein [Gaiella sp.]
MGKVLRELASGEMPGQTIFDRRMVVECCETFHVHWRNLRLELSHPNWLDFMATVARAGEAWHEAGAPPSAPHLELARHWIEHEVGGGEVDVELCDNLYVKAPSPFGEGALLDDPDFVHFHIHDLRVEMSVAEFVAFSGVLARARRPLVARAATVARLFEVLDEHNVLYVVLRNWEGLPAAVELGEHSDLDLLVHPSHVALLDELWQTERTFPEPYRVQRRVAVVDEHGRESFVLCDVRSPGDGYMPDGWSHDLIARRVREQMFWVLEPKDYFLSLLYHVVHHKGVMREDYAERLTALAATAGIPYDRGSSHDLGSAARLLSAHGIQRSEPDDPTVLPHLPYLYPVETTLSSRKLEPTALLSRVQRVPDVTRGTRIVKHVSGDGAEREARLTARVGGAHTPAVISAGHARGGSIADFADAGDGSLADPAQVGAAFRDVGAARCFLRGCGELLADLHRAGVRHRDIRPGNLLVQGGQPMLVDFGWAETDDDPLDAPEGLGGDGYAAPEGGHDDAYALGVALAGLAALHPEVSPVIAALTAPDPSLRPRTSEAIDALLEQGVTNETYRAALAAFVTPTVLGGRDQPRRFLLRAALERRPADDELVSALAELDRATAYELLQQPAHSLDAVTKALELLSSAVQLRPGDPRLHQLVGEAGAALEAIEAGHPVAPQPPSSQRTVAGEPVRDYVAVAHVTELVADPVLLHWYGTFFGADDDVTLVVVDFGTTVGDVVERLLPSLRTAGLAGEGGPDLLAIAIPPGGEQLVADEIDAVYGAAAPHSAFASLPRFGAERIADLRSVAMAGRALDAAA